MARYLMRDVSNDRENMGRSHSLLRVSPQVSAVMLLLGILVSVIFPLAFVVSFWVSRGFQKKLWSSLWKVVVCVVGALGFLGAAAGLWATVPRLIQSENFVQLWYQNMALQALGGVGFGILAGVLWWLRTYLNQPAYARMRPTAYTRTLTQSLVSKFWFQRRIESGAFSPEDCIVYGVESDKYSRGLPVFQRMEDVLHTIVFGKTGSGKSQTMLRVILAYMRSNLPGIIIDMKGDPQYRAAIRKLGEESNVKVYEWSLAEELGHYDPLASGVDAHSQMELVVNSLSWGEDYYRNIAEDALKTLFEVLNVTGPLTVTENDKTVKCSYLESVYHLMDIATLESYVLENLQGAEHQHLQNDALALGAKVKRDPRSYSGIIAQLKPLVETAAGRGMRPEGSNSFTLRQVFEEKAFVIISLNSLKQQSLARLLSALIMNDVQKLAGSLGGNSETPWLLAVDEFTHAGTTGLDAMLQQSRSSGARIMISTQSHADIVAMGERSGNSVFASQLTGQGSMLIVHQVDDDTAAWVEGRVPLRWSREETDTSHKKNSLLDSDSGALADQAFGRWVKVPALSAAAFTELGRGEFACVGNFVWRARRGDFVSSWWDIVRGVRVSRPMLVSRVLTVRDRAMLGEDVVVAGREAAEAEVRELSRMSELSVGVSGVSGGSSGVVRRGVGVVPGVGVEEFSSGDDGGDWV